MSSHRLGIVVEGGGIRGIYAAGVLDALLELKLPVKGVIGVSAGAIHACSFVSGQKGRSLRFYKRFCRDDRFFSFKTLIKTSCGYTSLINSFVTSNMQKESCLFLSFRNSKSSNATLSSITSL